MTGQATDVVVIGSGFGGAVAALRLAEKGYHVLVLEAGRRFEDDDFAVTSWRLRRYLWAPRLGCYGVQRIHLLPHVVVLAGAGVGGGSLNYANTLYRPPPEFYAAPQWPAPTDWRAELAPYYTQAERMLGVVANPCHSVVDDVWREVAGEMGVADTYRKAPVGVLFGEPGGPGGVRVADPFFGGAGPPRRTCTECGNCMVGCRVGAKNTLVKNYLALAEGLGVRIEPMRTVVEVRPAEPASRASGYLVTSERSGAWGPPGRRERRTVRCRQVVFAAGTWGTQLLLHRMRAVGVLPDLSLALGRQTRTNCEAIVGAVADRVPRRLGQDLTRGVAITSSFHPEPGTHVENCRYGPGSNAMGLLATLLVDGGPWRWLRWLRAMAGHPVAAARSLSVRRWSERTVIGLVMQTGHGSLAVSARRRRLRLGPGTVPLPGWRLVSQPEAGTPNPTWIPAGHQAIRAVAARMSQRTGVPTRAGGTVGDVFDVPMTAHFIGGCTLGSDAGTAVVDPYHRVFGYPGLHVVDGSAIPANPGVNPALTITALAERAFALWPVRGRPDPRPAPGQAYREVPPVPSARPAVPDGAPAANRAPVPSAGMEHPPGGRSR